MSNTPGVHARVAGGELGQHSGKSVLLLARVQSTQGTEATVSTADGSTVTVDMQADASGMPKGQWVQITGLVTGDARVQEWKHTAVQGDVDTALDCDEFVEALLRIALSAWQDDQSVPAPWQKMRKVRS